MEDVMHAISEMLSVYNLKAWGLLHPNVYIVIQILEVGYILSRW